MYKGSGIVFSTYKGWGLVNKIETIYPLSGALLPEDFSCPELELLPDYLKNHPEMCKDHPYLPDLARIERSAHGAGSHKTGVAVEVTKLTVHPELDLLEVSWSGLVELFESRAVRPQPGKEFIVVLPAVEKTPVRIFRASNHELLALKIVAEDIDSKTAAQEAQVSVGVIDNILYNAGQKGLLLFPQSKIVRSKTFSTKHPVSDKLLSSPAFTLQWHVTQACDLHCRHCYDRSDRRTMTVEQGLHVLDNLYDFCQSHNAYGQVSFTGGNPLLYPHFLTLYSEAVQRGFLTGILGNPMERLAIEEMIAIQKPEFYQVSLEGMGEHNDYIRGEGHYKKTLAFLGLLKELDIYSMVMLTLTRSNVEQVLPLADVLRGRTDLFTYNRLAMVGEGAALASVEPGVYREFLKKYIDTAKENPILRLKDNLCNLHQFQHGEPLQGGCAGVGCGAAFNFVSVLPDGEVHACRKLPSLLGNIYEDSLTDIYNSSLAIKYREGSSACADCEIRPACGGCPAVSYGFGLDIFTDRDPYCFKDT